MAQGSSARRGSRTRVHTNGSAAAIHDVSIQGPNGATPAGADLAPDDAYVHQPIERGPYDFKCRECGNWIGTSNGTWLRDRCQNKVCLLYRRTQMVFRGDEMDGERIVITMNLYPEEYEFINPGRRCKNADCGHLGSAHGKPGSDEPCMIADCNCQGFMR